MSATDLTELVLEKIKALGDAAAKDYFGVSHGTIVAWRSKKTPPNLAAAQKVLEEMPVEVAPAVPDLQIAAEPEPVSLPDQVCLGMPLYTDVEKLTFITLVRAMKFYGMEKISIIPIARTLIDEARNTIAQRFLLTGAEWLVFVDSDMILPCGNGTILKKMGLELPEPKASRNAIARIMSHPKEFRIVGALYQNRRPTFKPAVATAYASVEGNKHMRGFFDGTSKGDGLEETGWVGFGMVRLHRSVFLDMQAAAVPGGLLADIAAPKGREADAFGYFGRSSQWRGEDIAFCRRAEKIGIKTYVDTGLILGHQGERYNLG